MNRLKRTKRTLISGLVSIVLCLAMLVGSTLAWFTDTISATADLNFGSLNAALQKYVNGEYKNVGIKENDEDYGSADPVFGGTNWTPNQTEVYYLAVSNEGEIAFRYDMDITLAGDMAGALEYAIIDGLKAGTDDAQKLQNAVDMRDWDAVKDAAGEQIGLVESGALKAAPNGQLEMEEADYFALVLHMDENASNDYQGTYFKADIAVNARQVTYVEPSVDPFAEYTTTKIYDFENNFVVNKNNGVQPVQYNGGKVTKETEAGGNNYLSLKCLDDPKQTAFPTNFRAGFFNMNEGVANEQVLAYSFDIKLINEESYLYVQVPGGLKLQDGAIWFEKSVEGDRTDPANQVKLLDLVPGKWHTIVTEANFTTGEISYWADTIKCAETSTRTGLSVASFAEIRAVVSPFNYPATPDKYADIEVGIDNFKVMVPPYVDPFQDYKLVKGYDFENNFVVDKNNGVQPVQYNGGKVTKETEAGGNNYLRLKCLDDPKQAAFPTNFRAGFFYMNEGLTDEEVVTYSFDIKLINEESYLYVQVPGGLKLQDGAIWFEKRMDGDRTNAANQVKLLTLEVGKWHHISAEANFTTGEIYYYADGVKNPTPAIRTDLTIASFAEIRAVVSPYNYPATPDKTADIEVGIDNFMARVPVAEDTIKE